jgi:hypothetical protein
MSRHLLPSLVRTFQAKILEVKILYIKLYVKIVNVEADG